MFAKPYPAEKLSNVGADGFVSAADVQFLRRMVFKDGIVAPDELDALFTLGERAPKGDPEWGQFFEESAADFYLREEEPHGYFTADEFRTFKARVTHDGGTASGLELGLMVKLLEDAVETPGEMWSFVGDQIRKRLTAEGATGGVSKDHVDLVRRYIFAKGGDGNIAVSRTEAELLFDINDAARGAGHHASWTDFFVKSIANHLMAQSGYQPLSREEAKRLHDFAADHSVKVGGFFQRMLSGGLSALTGADKQSSQAARNAEREAAAAVAEQVTQTEADWLGDRIGRDGELRDIERALVDHIRGLGADLPPKLKALVERAA